MSDIEMVLKLEDKADEPWHAVIFHNVMGVHPGHIACEQVYTRCGLDVAFNTRFFDRDAPNAPTCPGCLQPDEPTDLIEEIEVFLRTRAPVTARLEFLVSRRLRLEGSMNNTNPCWEEPFHAAPSTFSPEAVASFVRMERHILELRCVTGWSDEEARKRIRQRAARTDVTLEETARLMYVEALHGAA